MLRIAKWPLSATTRAALRTLQKKIDDTPLYADRVGLAKREWDAKHSSQAKKAAFQEVRATLDKMCIGSRRCAYCEDSVADEIEHVLPKTLFPDAAFLWSNYLFSCGPCNGPKSNRYGVVAGEAVSEFIRRRGDPIEPPPAGKSGCIDPRNEDPLALLDLDLGGTTQDGEVLQGTFDFLPAEGLNPGDLARVAFTIDVLGLNREVIRVARQNAYGGFRARLREYRDERLAGASAARLAMLKADLLRTPHLTVFAEMVRQRTRLPEIDAMLAAAPEVVRWRLVPDNRSE